MPLTPLHYPVAYILYKLNNKLSLPGLVVGSMFPDLEVAAKTLLFGTRLVRNGHKLILSSLLGAATIGTMLSVIFTVLIYPLISSFFKIDKNKVERKCRFSFSLIFSCFLGNISHVLLDVVNHLNNPIFWPFTQSTHSPICLAIGTTNASLIASAILIVLFAAILINLRGNFWEKLLVEE